jgi:hypothetical protein
MGKWNINHKWMCQVIFVGDNKRLSSTYGPITIKEYEVGMSNTGPGSYYDYLGFTIAEDAINKNKGGGNGGGNGSGCLSVLFIISIGIGIMWLLGR